MRFMFVKSKLPKLLALLAAIGICLSCLNETKEQRQGAQPAIVSQDQPNEGGYDELRVSPFAKTQEKAQTIADVLGRLNAGPSSDEDLWALALCRCTPTYSAKYFSQLARKPGVLPQPLVPSVREAILEDPRLKLLAAVPEGSIGDLTRFFAQFATDERELGTAIRDNLNQQLSDALWPQQTNLAKRLLYIYEAFPTPFIKDHKQSAGLNQNFIVSEQASRWTWIFELEPMWQRQIKETPKNSALDGVDHGLQLFHTALALEEWQYLYGLKNSTQTGSHYGGLSFEPTRAFATGGAVATSGPLGKFDPRTDPSGPTKIISGSYKINYPSTKTVELASSVREFWSRPNEKISLDEQARLLYAAAKAFNRLRPENRGNVSGLFGEGRGLFPDNAHLLPLVILLGGSELLDGPFINMDSLEKEIFQFAQITGATQFDPSQANPLSLARLARALIAWTQETQDIRGAELSHEQVESLTSGRDSMKDAAGLSVITILANYVRHSADLPLGSPLQSGLRGYRLVNSPNDLSPPSMRAAAEVLATLALADQSVLGGPLLHNRVIGLYHWFASHYLTRPMTEFAPIDLIWLHHSLEQFKRYSDVSDIAWLEDALYSTTLALQIWQGEDE